MTNSSSMGFLNIQNATKSLWHHILFMVVYVSLPTTVPFAAIRAEELSDYQLRAITGRRDPSDRMSRWQQTVMSRPSYVRSFRIAGGAGAVLLLLLAIQVLIYN